jgi:DNA invertase Pin-like site-specific DNA recombinase
MKPTPDRLAPTRPAATDRPRPDPRRPSSAATGSAKIKGCHLERLAVVYVRQSTPQQVLNHRESTELQYNLARRAAEMGWPADRVLVIDDDLGLSARTAEGRAGFQRLLAEVGLGHVGLVLGIEMSRLARSCKDWHQLLELCAMFRTLLADQDGLYDPVDFNDRLLLGLKGTMSEAELHLLRSRMDQGLRNKAGRGELFTRLPGGYVFGPGGEVLLDPDEQAQAVVRLVFKKFTELGTVAAVVRYLVRNQIRLGIRPYEGPHRGQLQWRHPRRTTVLSMLHNPIYAGAYAYGRRQTDPRRKVPGHPGTGRNPVPMDEWQVLLRDRLPAYITWQRFLENQRRIAGNRARCEAQGAPREGPWLLGGLLYCGRCDWRMMVRYSGKSNRPRYSCRGLLGEDSGVGCQGLAARSIDDLVTRQVMEVLRPAAIELSLRAAADVARERDLLGRHWRQRLERARYEAGRAERQYQAVEPENRLVARELERRWEQALAEERRLREEYERFRLEQPEELTEADRTAIRLLARDVPALWEAAATTPAERQQIVRHLIERVVVNTRDDSEYVDATIRWAGGFVSRHELIRPVREFGQLRDYGRLMRRIGELHEAGETSDRIAAQVGREGFHSPKRPGEPLTAETIRKLLRQAGHTKPRHRSQREDSLLRSNEWWVSDLAGELGMPLNTLHSWRRRGWAHARQLPGIRGQNPWIRWADADEVHRLRRLRDCPRSWSDQPFPPELTTPKERRIR